MSDAVTDALSRAALYRVLATAFAYPASGHAADVARAAAGAAPSAPLEVRALLGELVRAAASVDADELPEVYVALFDRQVACPPYEGAYGVPQLSGKAMQLADIAGFYAAFGLTAAGRQPDADDHIGAELEFMAALALKEAWARYHEQPDHADTAGRAQRTFLDDHLARWGDSFADRVLELAPAGFYAAAARLLAAWLRAECARLGVVPRVLDGRATTGDEGPLSCPMAG
jgi:putative dimethyl sulfoxide reductase chaperone